jgi:hypothetical protein
VEEILGVEAMEELCLENERIWEVGIGRSIKKAREVKKGV